MWIDSDCPPCPEAPENFLLLPGLLHSRPQNRVRKQVYLTSGQPGHGGLSGALVAASRGATPASFLLMSRGALLSKKVDPGSRGLKWRIPGDLTASRVRFAPPGSLQNEKVSPALAAGP